jgi:hypothetical protein
MAGRSIHHWLIVEHDQQAGDNRTGRVHDNVNLICIVASSHVRKRDGWVARRPRSTSGAERSGRLTSLHRADRMGRVGRAQGEKLVRFTSAAAAAAGASQIERDHECPR